MVVNKGHITDTGTFLEHPGSESLCDIVEQPAVSEVSSVQSWLLENCFAMLNSLIERG